MNRCKDCGGNCEPIGNGRFRCEFCGATFREEDFTSFKEKMALETAKTKAAEEVRARAALEAEEVRARAAVEAEEVRARAKIEEAKVRAAANVSGADLFEQCKNGVLEISCRSGNMGWSGSGYVISYAGYAVTNAHVAAERNGSPCKNMVVRVAGRQIRANVVALADNRAGSGGGPDLAIIKLVEMPYDITPLPLGDFDSVRTGEQIFVIGNSLGYGTCITSGIVSDRNRSGHIMYDCATNPGNSGGPVINAKGEVIGTHSSGQRVEDGGKAQGMNYAVPVTKLKEFIKKTGIYI